MSNPEFNYYNIGPNYKPFIIAEMSGNHNQSLERAIEITKAAAKSGAGAIKLQTYTADTMTLNLSKNEFYIDDPKSLWSGNSLYDLYKKAYTPWEWHEEIMKVAKKFGILCFSTPFDETAVDFLEDLNVPLYKIASFENNHLPLIKKIIQTGKPIIISSGMASLKELTETVEYIREQGCKELIVLKCTSSYPASPESSNILTIPHMKKMLDCEVGLSDHTLGIGASLAAISHGAILIEKHFTVDRNDGGVDSAFSINPKELRSLVSESKIAWHSLGAVKYGPMEEEKNSLIFKRSIYISEDINENETLTTKNLRIVRPGLGLAPKYYELLLGRKVKRKIPKGTPFSWEMV